MVRTLIWPGLSAAQASESSAPPPSVPCVAAVPGSARGAIGPDSVADVVASPGRRAVVRFSDFLYLDGQRERGPAMAFIRCDQGSVPTDHHTLAMALQPRTGYVHSAYQLTDLDEVAAGGEYLRERGYRHAWGIGRHIQGSQIFDYWRDADRLMFEHYSDGDVFDSSVEPGWAPLSVSGLAQWGPKATADFTGARDPGVVVAAIKALRDKGNDVDLRALRGLIQGDELMSVNLARTADGWWVVTPAGLIRLGLHAATTAGLLADRAALDVAIEAALATAAAAPRDAVPAQSLDLLSPVTAPVRVVAQMVNYRSHALDSGLDPDTVPPAFFRKTSHSITGPASDIIRPAGVGFLDYEVELGLVIGAGPAGRDHGDRRQPRPLRRGARGHQRRQRPADPAHQDPVLRGEVLPHLHPGGPLADPDGRRRPGPAGFAAADAVGERAGAPGQHRGGHDRPAGAGADRAVPLPADGAGRPAADRHPRRHRADAPPKIVAKLAGLLPAATRWELFFKRQARNPRYLQDGDVITATITSADGRIDLGTQRNTVVGKTS